MDFKAHFPPPPKSWLYTQDPGSSAKGVNNNASQFLPGKDLTTYISYCFLKVELLTGLHVRADCNISLRGN